MNKNKLTNASEFRQKPVKDLLKLTSLFRQESKNYFAIGDEISHLVGRKGWKISDLAEYFNRSRSRLSEIYHTALTFGPEQRDYSIPFSHYEFARKASSDFSLAPAKALREIEKKELNQQRHVTRHFADKQRQKRNFESAGLAVWRKVGREEIIDRCHNEDCRDIAKRLHDGVVTICDLDAPYGEYGCYKDGHHDKAGAAMNGFDNGTNAQVIEIIDDMMAIMINKLAKNGVMFLWRPGGIPDPLHTEITASAKKYGWEIPKIITWHKGKAKLGGGNEPYTVDTEDIWLLHRRDDKPENHDNSSRSIVLEFAPVTQRAITALESHLFIKPRDLYKFIISKHSYEGELIFDACGCSGNCSIAALELNRQFIYSETNSQNYELGSGRIYEAIKQRQVKTG